MFSMSLQLAPPRQQHETADDAPRVHSGCQHFFWQADTKTGSIAGQAGNIPAEAESVNLFNLKKNACLCFSSSRKEVQSLPCKWKTSMAPLQRIRVTCFSLKRWLHMKLDGIERINRIIFTSSFVFYFERLCNPEGSANCCSHQTSTKR